MNTQNPKLKTSRADDGKLVLRCEGPEGVGPGEVGSLAVYEKAHLALPAPEENQCRDPANCAANP